MNQMAVFKLGYVSLFSVLRFSVSRTVTKNKPHVSVSAITEATFLEQRVWLWH